MDSPVRKMQKRNDYNRHKLLRKIKRQRRAQVEQQKVAAEKELKRRLMVTPPKFGDGKEPTLQLNSPYFQIKDQPLSGTDPIGEFFIENVAFGKILSNIVRGARKARRLEKLSDYKMYRQRGYDRQSADRLSTDYHYDAASKYLERISKFMDFAL